MTDPWRKQRQGAPSVRRFIQERSPAASHGFSRIAKHETWLFCNPPWSRRPTACQGFGVTNHETRNTAVPSWFPAHDFPPFPTISQVPPPKKIEYPRARRQPGQRLHGCLESPRKRPWPACPAGWRGEVRPGHESRPVRFTGRQRCLPGANQAPANGFHESRDTSHETRPFYRVLRPSWGEKCRLGAQKR